jgi:D-xylose transport system substrate-binding protein
MKLFSTKQRSFTLMTGVILFALILAGCGSANSGGTGSSGSTPTTSSASTNGKGCTKVGVLLPETATSARWDGKDKPALTTDIQAISGVTVDYYNAQGSSATQQNQADQALTKGDCILVVAPNDSAASAAIVTKAKTSGVPVIAYDRIIQSKDLNYYVSFDNEQVGKLQGQYILAHYKDYVKGTGKNNIVLINGAQTDQNAILFNKGVEETLQPLFANKTLNKVYDQFTPNWDNPTAETEMEGALTKYSNNIQIAYVANDGMASTVIAALKAQHLNGKVLVTGQDATDAGIHSILIGDQSMTVYKAIIKEAQATADIVKALHDGTAPATTATSTTTDGGSIPSVLEAPVTVDKTNILTTVVQDNYITDKTIVCASLPAGAGGYC